MFQFRPQNSTQVVGALGFFRGYTMLAKQKPPLNDVWGAHIDKRGLPGLSRKVL